MFHISTGTVPARRLREDRNRVQRDHALGGRTRTKGAPGTYEWWYFDARLDDGAKLVVVFFDQGVQRSQPAAQPGA